jgi:hypothetical protein
VGPRRENFDRFTRKLPIYARERVEHVWLVDSALRTPEALRLDGAGYRILRAWHGDAIAQAEPLEAHALHLAESWSA